MIRVSFKKKNDKWVAYEVSGHAGFADNGYDIVCAAVSALAITTCNSIESQAAYQPIVDVEEELGGFLYVETLADLTAHQEMITQVLLENLYSGLQAIAQDYPEFVTITVIQ